MAPNKKAQICCHVILALNLVPKFGECIIIYRHWIRPKKKKKLKFGILKFLEQALIFIQSPNFFIFYFWYLRP